MASLGLGWRKGEQGELQVTFAHLGSSFPPGSSLQVHSGQPSLSLNINNRPSLCQGSLEGGQWRAASWGAPGPATRPLLPHAEVHLGKWKRRITAITDGASPVPGPVLGTGCVQSDQSSRHFKVKATFGDEQTESQGEMKPLAQGFTASKWQR